MTALNKTYSLLAAGIVLGAAAFAAKPASATLGMEMHCQGTENCGMGGAGLAMNQGPISAALNPALGAKMGNQAMLSVGWFWADVEGEARSDGARAFGVAVANVAGKQTSSADNFPVGSMAVNYRIDDKMTANLSIYPGGGGATEWKYARTNGAVGGGTNDSHDQQIDYMSLHIAPSVAYKMNSKLSVGAGIIFSYSRIETDSLDNRFNNPFGGADEYEYFKGIGGRIGMTYDVSDEFSVGAMYRSQVFHETLTRYRNIFNGAINQPSSWGVGGTYKMSPSTTFAGDLKWVNWAEVDAIGATPRATNSDPVCCGGFGWKSVPVFAVGAEHLVDTGFKVRAGYTYGRSPIDDSHVFANFLFPAVTTHHLNAGATYAIADGTELGLSAYWAPENSLKENGDGDFFSSEGEGTTLSSSQYGFQVSVKQSF